MVNKKSFNILIVIVLLFFGAAGHLRSELPDSTDKINSERFIKIMQAYFVYPDDEMAKKLYQAVPEKLYLPKEKKVEIAAYLFYGGVGYEIDCGNQYIIRAALKLLKAIGGEEDEDVYYKLNSLLYMYFGDMIRRQPELFLGIVGEARVEINIEDLEKIATYLPQDFWLNQRFGQHLCDIKPLEIICLYQLIKRQEALQRTTGHEEIKAICLRAIDERLAKLGFYQLEERYKKMFENNRTEREIVEKVTELLRFILYGEHIETGRPELLPENYESLKKSNRHLGLDSSLTSFLFDEVESYNRFAAEVFVKGSVGYHFCDWEDLLVSLIRRDPVYFLELYSDYAKANEEKYEPWSSGEFNNRVIRAILRGRGLPVEKIDGVSSQITLLPKIIELDKRAKALSSIEEEKYAQFRDQFLIQLVQIIKDCKRELFKK